MAEYEIDNLLTDFESSIDEPEEPLSKKLSEDEIAEIEMKEAADKKKKREKQEVLKEKLLKKAEKKEKKEEEQEEEELEELKRAELIRRLRRILKMRGAERKAALQFLRQEFPPSEVDRIAEDYMGTAPEVSEEKEEIEEEPELKTETQTYSPSSSETYGGISLSSEKEKNSEPYALKSEESSFEKEEPYSRKEENIFSAKRQIERLYGNNSDSESQEPYRE